MAAKSCLSCDCVFFIYFPVKITNCPSSRCKLFYFSFSNSCSMFSLLLSSPLWFQVFKKYIYQPIKRAVALALSQHFLRNFLVRSKQLSSPTRYIRSKICFVKQNQCLSQSKEPFPALQFYTQTCQFTAYLFRGWLGKISGKCWAVQ